MKPSAIPLPRKSSRFRRITGTEVFAAPFAPPHPARTVLSQRARKIKKISLSQDF
jgi:hypothetical protein